MTNSNIGNKIVVLGKTFDSDEERRSYFREELRKKLPELKKMEGFPIGEDEDILNLSDPPFFTACPNPWLNDFINEWESEKIELEKKGNRIANFHVNEPYAADISEGKNNPIYNAHSYHTKVPHPAIIRYILHYTQPGDVVFDGFSGTGMTGVAALACADVSLDFKFKVETEWQKLYNKKPVWGERKAILNDLSPIASFIAYNLNNPFSIPEFVDLANLVMKKVKSNLGWTYETQQSQGMKGEIIYSVWSSIYICPNCSEDLIFWDSSMNESKTKQTEDLKCNQCGVITKKRNCLPKKETFFDESCNQTLERVAEIPVFINCIINGKRIERKLNENDLEVINKINNYRTTNFFPNSQIMGKGKEWGDTYRAGYHTGITNYHHLYTKRNLIIISDFFNEIIKLDCDERLKKALLFWFTSSQNRLDRTNRYSFNHSRHVGPLSNTLYLSATPAEISPFYFFQSKLDHLKKVIFPKSNSVIQIGDTTKIHTIANDSIDYLFIDPPYGDNIPYAELNSVLEAWLKVRTSIDNEAIISSKTNKSLADYQKMLLKAFMEYYRILKPNKWMTVVFSNTEASVWNVIQNSLTQAGFVVSNVSAIDTSRPGLHGIIGPVAVQQPLVISCFKPSSDFQITFARVHDSEIGVWSFIEEYMNHLPVHIEKTHHTTSIIERNPKILFDRMIAYYVQRGLPVPIDAIKFQQGLRIRFIERDGMFFTNEQVQEYDAKKAAVPDFIQLSIFVTNEQDSIYWLRNILENGSKTESDLHPFWMKEVASNMRKGDALPEMRTILEENFLKNDNGKWYVPDPENEADLEKLRNKRLIKQFDVYRTEIADPRVKIKEVRVEALRAGFKQCYQDKDFKTIVNIGDRIPNNLLMEDEVLLQFYDIASSRI